MPENRPPADAETAPSFGLIVAILVVLFGLGALAMHSGAIEALSVSGLFGR